MHPEIKLWAEHSLVCAFWRDFSALVNAYMKAAEGLDEALVESLMQDETSVYGRDLSADSDFFVEVYSEDAAGYTVGHTTLARALTTAGNVSVHLQGKKIFERRSGEWFFVG